jgi:transcriptional regulator with XRE-family HTH domain
MPPPRTSILLTDPARLAAVLHAMQRAGRPNKSGTGYEELSLRAMARAIGISAPSLLALMRGECARMRFLTYLKLRRYVHLLYEGATEARRRSRGGLGRESDEQIERFIARIERIYQPEFHYADVAIEFYECAGKTFRMPMLAPGEWERLEEMVNRRRGRRFARVRPHAARPKTPAG